MTVLTILAIIVGAVLCVVFVVLAMFFNLWLQSRASGVPVSFLQMALMRLRRVRPHDVVGALIPMAKAGLDVNVDEVETHVLAGGDLNAVVDALIRAAKADLDIDFRRIAAIDLAGRDVGDAVRTHISPKVLVCPAPTREANAVSGVCQDGIRLTATARVTVRTRLDRLVGGAGEQTIIARVGEGIVSAIGQAERHQQILEQPEQISRYILDRGLDSGTCFEIVSVDIADVNVEDNVGARLQTVQANADKRVAQAKAEVRRAAAVAAHKEMEAKTIEMESFVRAAEAVVPEAVSAAFLAKNIGRRLHLPPTVNNRLRWRSAT